MVAAKLHATYRWSTRFLQLSLVWVLTTLIASHSAQALQCRAIDGDTLRCGKERVRLANVYAAEKSDIGGKAAKAHLAALVNGQDVTLKRVAIDKYGRTLAKVVVGGHEINQADIGSKAGRGTQGYTSKNAGPPKMHQAKYPTPRVQGQKSLANAHRKARRLGKQAHTSRITHRIKAVRKTRHRRAVHHSAAPVLFLPK
jgi:micrococcal nuclease